MRTITTILFLFIIQVVAHAQSVKKITDTALSNQPSVKSVNESFPPVKQVKIEELENIIKNSDHPLVISFWATWCAPCVREIPWIMESIEKRKEQKVEFILVSLDFAEAFPKKLNAFIKSKKFIATHFWLNETNADHFCPKIDPKWEGGIPANLFINNQTGYRKFFQRQLTDRQVEQEIGLLVKD